MPHSSQPRRPAAERLAWADVLKGLCIVLVVLHHEVSKDLASLGFAGAPWLLDAWREADSALGNLRMPLFFVVSGLLAAPALHRPWRALLGPRLANPYYLFVLWSALQGAFFLVGPDLRTNPIDGTGEFLANLALPSTTLWYLFALPTYFALARLLVGRVPVAWLLLAGAVLFTIVRAGLLPPAPAGHAENIGRVVAYPGFFLLGAYAPARLAAIAERATLPRVGWLAAGFCATSLMIAALHLKGAPGAPLVASLLAIALGFTAAGATAHAAPRLASVVGALGRKTLPIYILHLPLLALAHAAGLRLGVLDGAGASAMLVIWPLAATAVVVGASLLLHRCLLAAGGRVLFTLPEALLNPWHVPALTTRRQRRRARRNASTIRELKAEGVTR